MPILERYTRGGRKIFRRCRGATQFLSHRSPERHFQPSKALKRKGLKTALPGYLFAVLEFIEPTVQPIFLQKLAMCAFFRQVPMVKYDNFIRLLDGR